MITAIILGIAASAGTAAATYLFFGHYWYLLRKKDK